MGGSNLKNHLSHTDSVRLRLLLKIRFHKIATITPLTMGAAASSEKEGRKEGRKGGREGRRGGPVGRLQAHRVDRGLGSLRG